MSKSLLRLVVLAISLNLPNSSIVALNNEDDWVILNEDNENNDTDWVVVEDKEDIDKLVGKFIIAPECSRYPFDGEEGLKNDLRSSLTVGLAGLMKHRSKDFHKLREILLGSQAPKIFCAFSGEKVIDDLTMRSETRGVSLAADAASYPAIALNLSNTDSSTQVQETIFHELIHLLGYCHYDGADIAYLAQSCFFSKDEQIASQAAKLLKEEHSWLSKEYQIEFFRIMAKQNIEIALRTILAAYQQIEGPLKNELWDSLLSETDLAQEFPFVSSLLPGGSLEPLIVADGTQKPLFLNKTREMLGYLINKNYSAFKKNIASYLMLRASVSKILNQLDRDELELLQDFSSFNAEDLSEAELHKWRAGCNATPFIYREKTPNNCFLTPARIDTEAGILEDLSLVIQTFEIALGSGFDSMRKKARESLEEKSLRFGEKYLLHLLSGHLLHTGRTQGPYMFVFFKNLFTDESIIMQKIAARALRYLAVLDKHEIFALALESESEQVVSIAKDSIKRRRDRI